MNNPHNKAKNVIPQSPTYYIGVGGMAPPLPYATTTDQLSTISVNE